MHSQRFSISESLSFGWDTMKHNTGFFIALLAVAFLIEYLPRIFAMIIRNDFPFIAVLFSLSGIVLGIVVQMGLIRVSLKFCDGTKGQLDDLLSTFHLLVKFGLAWILYFFIVVCGLVLLVVPGIIWGTKFSLFPYFIVDNAMGPVQALKASSRATSGAKWQLFLFFLLVSIITMAGALAFLVGLFVTVPVTMIAFADVYRTLAGRAPGGMQDESGGVS